MAGIREIARQYRDEIMDGIAWVAIWKTGKSWNAKAFWLNLDSDMIEEEDMQEARDIVAADANAIFINEYYCAHMCEGKLDDIVAAIRFFYEEGWHTLEDSTAYRAEAETTEKEEQEENGKQGGSRHEGVEGNQTEAEGNGGEGSAKDFPPCTEDSGARMQAGNGGENQGGSAVAARDGHSISGQAAAPAV